MSKKDKRPKQPPSSAEPTPSSSAELDGLPLAFVNPGPIAEPEPPSSAEPEPPSSAELDELDEPADPRVNAADRFAPHERRVFAEQRELVGRTQRLAAFLAAFLDAPTVELHPRELDRLRRQLGHMLGYQRVLDERIRVIMGIDVDVELDDSPPSSAELDAGPPLGGPVDGERLAAAAERARRRAERRSARPI